MSSKIKYLFGNAESFLNTRTLLTRRFLIALIVIYPFAFIWQGGDLTDSGFFAVRYRYFFDFLSMNEINILTFFTDLIGAVWLKILSGVIALNFLYLLFLYACSGMVYLILKDFTPNKNLLLLGVFIGDMFFIRFQYMVFNVDIASLLFLLITVFCLIKGLKSGEKKLLFFAGINSAIACMARLPDLTILVLVLVVIFHNEYLKHKDIGLKRITTRTLNNYFLYVSGFAFSCICMAGLLWHFGMLDAIKDDFLIVSLRAKDGGSSHGISRLLKNYFSELLIFVPHFIAIVFFTIAVSQIWKHSRNLLFSISCSLIALVLIPIAYTGYSYGNDIKYFAPAFLLFPVSVILLGQVDRSRQAKFSSLILLSLGISLVQVFGTATGLFLKMNYGLMLVIPLMIIVLFEIRNTDLWGLKISWKPPLIMYMVIIFCACLIIRLGWIYHVSSGLISRVRAVYSIDNDLMWGVHTTKDRAQYINEITHSIENHKGGDNTLFIYGTPLMLYYLSNMRPFTKHIWITQNVIKPRVLFEDMSSRLIQSKQWPLIIDTKENAMGSEGKEYLDTFLADNHYTCVENNKDYSIFKRDVIENY
ncbi:hypothetical protein [Reichenbachiella sp. MALMAid0571]|uniref:hypothetical protein n=1 Tax=Reichenbachiella sp. MALMAid0571 TaxID=3143939 RepID=UPI0032DEF6C4